MEEISDMKIDGIHFAYAGWLSDKVLKFTDIDTEKVVETINGIKLTMCAAIGEGDVKVYFTTGGSAGIALTASFGAGIEVTFKCEKP